MKIFPKLHFWLLIPFDYSGLQKGEKSVLLLCVGGGGAAFGDTDLDWIEGFSGFDFPDEFYFQSLIFDHSNKSTHQFGLPNLNPIHAPKTIKTNVIKPSNTNTFKGISQSSDPILNLTGFFQFM